MENSKVHWGPQPVSATPRVTRFHPNQNFASRWGLLSISCQKPSSKSVPSGARKKVLVGTRVSTG